MTVQLVNLEVPLSPFGVEEQAAYNPAEIGINLTAEERVTIRRIISGCAERGLTEVQTGADVVRWLLEQVDDQAD